MALQRLLHKRALTGTTSQQLQTFLDTTAALPTALSSFPRPSPSQRCLFMSDQEAWWRWTV